MYLSQKKQRQALTVVIYCYIVISIFLGLAVLYFEPFSLYSILIMIAIFFGCFLMKKILVLMENNYILYNDNELIINKPLKRQVIFNWKDISYYSKLSVELNLYDFNNKKILTVYAKNEEFSTFNDLIIKKNIPQKDIGKKEIIKRVLLILILIVGFIALKVFDTLAKYN